METLSWILCIVLAIIVFLLLVRLHLLEKSSDEIFSAFHDRLTTDTNILIDISSHNRHIRKLASGINQELRILRKERHRYEQGNSELKDAVMNISHDLRTPLTAIFGYLELLEQEEKSEDAKRYLAMIASRSEALKQLTEELFQYSILASNGEETRELVTLNSLLEESMASFYGVMKSRNIEPVITIPKERVERQLNRNALLRIFENIVSNAIKYTDGDLSIDLKVDGTIIFRNHAKNLSSVDVGKLFDRFYTVQTGRNSTGLGLSIAKLLTQQQGGMIRADYQEEQLRIVLIFE